MSCLRSGGCTITFVLHMSWPSQQGRACPDVATLCPIGLFVTRELLIPLADKVLVLRKEQTPKLEMSTAS